MPANGAEIGTERAANKITKHVNHVEPASRRWIDAVNTGLVGDVGNLDSQIHEDHGHDEAGKISPDDAHKNERNHAEPQGHADGDARSVFASQVAEGGR